MDVELTRPREAVTGSAHGNPHPRGPGDVPRTAPGSGDVEVEQRHGPPLAEHDVLGARRCGTEPARQRGPGPISGSSHPATVRGHAGPSRIPGCRRSTVVCRVVPMTRDAEGPD